MADDSAPVTHVTVAAPSTVASLVAQVNWMSIAKGSAVLLIGAAIFWMEMTGHSDKGTFINVIAYPVLGLLGVNHLVTAFQGAKPNA